MSTVFVVMVREKADNNPDNVGVDGVYTSIKEAEDYATSSGNLFGDCEYWVVTTHMKGH